MDIDDYAGLSFCKTAPAELTSRARDCLIEIVDENVGDVVHAFYDAFLNHEQGRAFLDHSVVHSRLSHSMRGWIRQIVRTDIKADLGAFIEAQSRIGMVHARIKVPNQLVMQGASLMKTSIARKVAEKCTDANLLAACLVMLDELVDAAIVFMTESYVKDTRQRAKMDEAFRLYTLGQDVNLERETQRAALMEWSQSVLLGLLNRQGRAEFRSLASSEFGLWVRHRAALLFQGDPHLSSLETLVAQVDAESLPAAIEKNPDAATAIGVLQQRIEEIKFLLNDMFQTSGTIESGRDPLTRALNRRFMPSVLNREITLARANNLPLTVALVDVDHFKQINDTFGHGGGDFVLSRVAEALFDNVRSSDFVFRYGGEEFLIVFTEIEADEAKSIANRICSYFSQHPMATTEGKAVPLTVSIGIAAFEGHPDYAYLVKAADEALYRAKREGRNRVVLAA